MDLIYLYPGSDDSPAKVGKSILEHIVNNRNCLPFENIKIFKIKEDINIKDDNLKNLEIINLTDIIKYQKNYLVHIPISPNIFPNKKFLLNLLCIVKKKPIIINYHGDIRKHIITKFKNENKIDPELIPSAFLMPYMLKSATRIITHSHLLDFVLKNNYCVKNSVVIPNGIDDYWFKPLEDDYYSNTVDKKKFNIFFHGRLSSEKGVDFLVNAVGVYIKANPNVMLYIAGEGPQKKYLEQLCETWNITNNVVFTGNLDKETIKSFLKRVDVAIYPSRFDNFPLSIMESLACADCPIYFSEETGLCDFATKDGYVLNLFKPTIENIVCLLKSPSNNENIIKSQKDFAKEYTWDKIIKEYINLYTILVKQSQQHIRGYL